MAVLLHRDGGGEDIPLSRWVLDFTGTFRLWRRMKLWRIRDYGAAVDMELSRLAAVEALCARFGKTWPDKVPGDLAWMLGAGVHMDKALARVAELTAPKAAPDDTPKPAARPRQTSRQKRATSAAKSRAKAVAILTATPDRPLADVAKESGVSERTASRIKSELPRRLHVAAE